MARKWSKWRRRKKQVLRTSTQSPSSMRISGPGVCPLISRASLLKPSRVESGGGRGRKEKEAERSARVPSLFLFLFAFELSLKSSEGLTIRSDNTQGNIEGILSSDVGRVVVKASTVFVDRRVDPREGEAEEGRKDEEERS